METALSAGTPEGLSIVPSELAPSSLPAPAIPKPAALEALRKSRLDQFRPSMFTDDDSDTLLLPIATIHLSPVQVYGSDYSSLSFYAF